MTSQLHFTMFPLSSQGLIPLFAFQFTMGDVLIGNLSTGKAFFLKCRLYFCLPFLINKFSNWKILRTFLSVHLHVFFFFSSFQVFVLVVVLPLQILGLLSSRVQLYVLLLCSKCYFYIFITINSVHTSFIWH